MQKHKNTRTILGIAKHHYNGPLAIPRIAKYHYNSTLAIPRIQLQVGRGQHVSNQSKNDI